MRHHHRPSLEDIIFWLLILCGIGLAWMLVKGLANIVVRLSQAKKQERVNEIFNRPDND